jgi:hypothetical protein
MDQTAALEQLLEQKQIRHQQLFQPFLYKALQYVVFLMMP